MKFTVAEMLAGLPLPATEKWTEGVWDIEPFKSGKFSLIFFAPHGTDHQTFHEKDEFYFIVRGNSELVMENETVNCRVGDAIFVPALKPHHFETFSEDFATWAVFF